MTPENLIGHALVIVAQLAGPPLLAALLVGLTVGIMQTATQVNESSISFVAKLLAVIAALVVAGPYMTRTVVAYTRENIASLAEMVR
ncbi:MAG TPA: flagellar biosynthetic protein FliQ [Polyangiaceae bacterium]|nr:flagellar biosynthetic protein FliQ [Polyangiaceae bacterium]